VLFSSLWQFVWVTLFGFSSSSLAFESVRVSDGEKTQLSANPVESTIRIYIENGCPHCQRYLRDLARCSKEITKRVELIAIGPSSYIQRIRNEALDASRTFWVAPSTKFEPEITAVPATQVGNERRIGVLTCQQLSEWSRL